MTAVNIGVSDIEEQKKRIVLRDGEQALKRLEKQFGLEKREQLADLSVRNDKLEDMKGNALSLIDNVLKAKKKGLLDYVEIIILVLVFLIVILLALARKALEK